MSNRSGSRDWRLIWVVNEGKQRYATDLVDDLVEDDVPLIRQRVFEPEQPSMARSYRLSAFIRMLSDVKAEMVR